jgi:hypothetical protein
LDKNKIITIAVVAVGIIAAIVYMVVTKTTISDLLQSSPGK